MLVFEDRGKQKYAGKNLSEQSTEPATNSTHIWCRIRESNPEHIAGRRALSAQHLPCWASMVGSNLGWNPANIKGVNKNVKTYFGKSLPVDSLVFLRPYSMHNLCTRSVLLFSFSGSSKQQLWYLLHSPGQNCEQKHSKELSTTITYLYLSQYKYKYYNIILLIFVVCFR